MIPGMNQKAIQQAMKKMGMKQEEIPASEVIIKGPKEIIIKNPHVIKVNMMGQETFQISGEIHEQELSTAPEISEEDVKTVMEQANVDENSAKEAIEKAEGDLAEAILYLTKTEE